jgi:hypothetical protein
MEPFAAGPVEFPDVASGLNIPPSLQASIDRHRTHLVQLVTTLRAAGLPGAQIEASVNTIISSYRSELIEALKSMTKADPDAL